MSFLISEVALHGVLGGHGSCGDTPGLGRFSRKFEVTLAAVNVVSVADGGREE